MRHQLHLDLAAPTIRESVVGLRKITLRERLARLVLGNPGTFTVIVPGESVDQVTITQKDDSDDLMALAKAVGVSSKDGERA